MRGYLQLQSSETLVSSNEMFAQTLLFVAARLDDIAPLPLLTIIHHAYIFLFFIVGSVGKMYLQLTTFSESVPEEPQKKKKGKKKNFCFFYYYFFKELHYALITVKTNRLSPHVIFVQAYN